MTENVALTSLSATRARRRVQTIRDSFQTAWRTLGEAYRDKDWIELNYPSWEAYCEGEYGDLLDGVQLTVAARRAVVKMWLVEFGMTNTAAAKAANTSRPTIQGDRNYLEREGELDELPETSRGVDGKVRRSRHIKPLPAFVPAGESKTDTALRLVREAGERGLTSIELESKLPEWKKKPGLASGTLSRLKKRGLVMQAGDPRLARYPYVIVQREA